MESEILENKKLTNLKLQLYNCEHLIELSTAERFIMHGPRAATPQATINWQLLLTRDVCI